MLATFDECASEDPGREHTDGEGEQCPSWSGSAGLEQSKRDPTSVIDGRG
jgi:hypothetical protein